MNKAVTTTQKEEPNYFEELARRAELLSDRGQEYLDGFSFMANEKIISAVVDKIYSKYGLPEEFIVWQSFDWNQATGLEQSILDGWFPYAGIPKNGSLRFSLGFSPVANDANLRNVYEHIVNGAKLLDLPIIADVDVDESGKIISVPENYLKLTFYS